MQPDPAAIAAKLTPAQRDALMMLPGDGEWRLLHDKWPDEDTRTQLRLRGLLRQREGTRKQQYGRATPLGLDVRAVLEAQR